ncbi:alpha/beta hydrolase [Glaciihabitans sp. UYNi722]|uniref:alpha/beta hydrolase n=1 Tax=Glaciihabitans sp. UYNi722 TaxID=3156344 RepID=UPI0033958C3A
MPKPHTPVPTDDPVDATPEEATPEGFHVPPRLIPAPVSLSADARRSLHTRTPAPNFPDLDDLDGWRNLVTTLDAGVGTMIEHLTGSIRSRITDTEIGGVPCFTAEPPTIRPKGQNMVILDIHGGGLYQGGGALARALTGVFADIRRLRIVGIDYRMPPDHPYPAALDDCVTVYRTLLQDYPAESIIFSGASAGGNLAAATILHARDEGLPLPRGVLLISPEIDLTESGDTFSTLAGIDTLHSLAPVNRLYARGHDLTDPLLSPLFANYSDGFPPTYLQSGTRDLYLSNTVRMHRTLRHAGIPVECHIFEGRPHLGFGGTTPEDLDTLHEQDHFISTLLGT